jgi:hypothetical protein
VSLILSHLAALYTYYHNAECCYAECRYAECHYAECRYAECHYAECHCAECRYAECRYYHIMILIYFTVGSTSSGSAFVIAPNLGAKILSEYFTGNAPPLYILDLLL